jgi:Holliday junction resolvase RusA-like endonuclease
MTTFTFTVHGRPASKGSTRSFVPKTATGYATRPDGSPIVVTKSDDERVISWQGDVSKACAQAMAAEGIELQREGALAVSVCFYRVRPRGHYGTGRNALVLKPSSPERPDVRPDTDKLMRAILDALKGTAYADDGQVADQHGRQYFGDQARAEIEVRSLLPVPAQQALAVG